MSAKERPWIEINWEEQWKSFGWNYRNGFIHLDVRDFGFRGALMPQYGSIRLKPGPGFGDLSHFTTQLMLRLMSDEVENEIVLDIGSGSGILSLAAIAMGAARVYGVEIDPSAIIHAQENAKLNKMQHHVSFCLSDDLDVHETKPLLACINMIHSEQLIAWRSLKPYEGRIGRCVASGILTEARESYLACMESFGWSLLKEIQEDQWLAFLFNHHGVLFGSPPTRPSQNIQAVKNHRV